MTIDLVLRVLATVCFFLVAINAPPSRLSYLGAGLFLWVLTTFTH